MAQKVSKKLTRAQKQAISMERWAIIRELSELQEEIKIAIQEVMRSSSSYAEFRKQLKGVKATKTDVRAYVKKRFGLKLGKQYTAPSFENKMRPVTILDSLGLLPGVATSIYNVISKSNRYNELLQVVKWFVGKFGAEEASTVWINQYFQSRSNPYEDEGLGYITNIVKGEDVLADWTTLMKAYAEMEQQ